MEGHCGVGDAAGGEEERGKLKEVLKSSLVDTSPTQSGNGEVGRAKRHFPERRATKKCWVCRLSSWNGKWPIMRYTGEWEGGEDSVPAQFPTLDLIFWGHGQPQTPCVDLGYALITLLSVTSHAIIKLALWGEKSSPLLQCVQSQMHSTNKNEKQPHQILKICFAKG